MIECLIDRGKKGREGERPQGNEGNIFLLSFSFFPVVSFRSHRLCFYIFHYDLVMIQDNALNWCLKTPHELYKNLYCLEMRGDHVIEGDTTRYVCMYCT